MNIATFDSLIARLARVGQAGALPKDLAVPQLIDELQRELSALADAMRALLTLARAAPGFDKDAHLFLIDARTASSTFNVLTTAQATTEGFGAIAGLVVFRHGLGVRLDRCVITYSVIIPPAGAPTVNGQALRSGAAVLYGFDEQRTVFQIDQEAATNQMLAIASCYPSRPVPSLSVNPGASQKTGAAAPQLGFVKASTPQREIP